MNLIKRIFSVLLVAVITILPLSAFAADNSLIDQLNLAPLIPSILDSIMWIASSGYDFFVGKGDGIVYIMIFGFLAISLALYLLKMYFPKTWVSFFGFSGGGEMESGISGLTISYNLLKPCIRAIIAVTILLQIRPVFLTEWLINPFLQFGAIYTESLMQTINETGVNSKKIECPESIIQQGWITQTSCEFLVQPVSDLSHANNQIIKRGFEFIKTGLRGMLTLIPHGGENFLNLITGIFLVFTFVSSNLFMALLIIQAIFNFGMVLVLYPFQVLAYVVKPNDKWFDIWPAFSGITKSLQQIVVTMIACAFILCVNIAIIKALFQWNSSVFVVSAGGTTTTNLPTNTVSALGFGEHSIMWLSSILTFYLMFRIFELTREQLNSYVDKGMDKFYNKVRGDTKKLTTRTKNLWSSAKDIYKLVKKK